VHIIDSHFHIYKSAQAGLMAQGGESLAGFRGTFEEALPILDRGQITKIMALAVIPIAPMRQAGMKNWPVDLTTSQKQELSAELETKMQTRLSSYNDWLCRIARDDGRIEPAIAADATIGSQYMAAEIQSKINDYQIRVLKIHPTVNNLTPDHDGYLKIFDLAHKNDLVVISHGGIAGDDLEGKYCSPEKFKMVLNNFPNLKLVVAHLAYPHIKDLLELVSKYKNVYTDISFILRNSPISDDDFCNILKNFGPERVLFGSDFPWSDPEQDAQRLMKFKLDKNELEMVAWQNAMNLFQLT
jgi:predicted TIM-barrel fold metal-dependent hydrolase